MPMDKWDACAFPVSEDDLEGRICYGGLDLSSTTDITAFVLVFPPLDEEDKYCVLPYFWIPEETLELRVRRDHVPYDVWERQGFLQTTEGNVVHYGYIEKFIERLGERFNIREIAFDRWGAVQMVQNLEGMGFTVVPFGQGFKDLVIGQKSGKDEVLLTLLERKTRDVSIIRLPDKSADSVFAAFQKMRFKLGDYFSKVFRTITTDNGSEFARLAELERGTSTKVYFTHPYTSCEKGSIENHNGLIRRFIPKGKRIADYGEDDILAVELWANSLPRKVLGYKTPDEVFEAEMDKIYAA